MSSQVLDPVKAAALELLAAGVDAVLDAGIAPVDAADARTLITELEVQTRRLRCEQIDVLNEVDRRGLHKPDGHTSAKAMVGYVANLSGGEASRRASSGRALRDMPLVRESMRAGRIGGSQVERIAAAHANPRVRGFVVANDEAFAAQAEAVGYRLFQMMVTNWVNHLDEDGPRDRNQRRHESRDFKLHQDFDATWAFTGGCASLQGTEMAEIFDRFYEAETLADWAEARTRLGDFATATDLARTDAQRRSDASLAIFRQAASHHASNGGSQIVTNVVIDHATFERLVKLFFGAEPEPVAPPLFGDPDDQFRCSTLDGRPVDPTEAVAQALLGQVRRAVVGADSVVIDLGRRVRLFGGSPALAVRLSSTECYWPGCHVPVSNCQIDHLKPWADRGGGRGGGCTNPGNGGPACGRHNRLKEHGYTVWRDEAGNWHVHRPDGTEIL